MKASGLMYLIKKTFELNIDGNGVQIKSSDN